MSGFGTSLKRVLLGSPASKKRSRAPAPEPSVQPQPGSPPGAPIAPPGPAQAQRPVPKRGARGAQKSKTKAIKMKTPVDRARRRAILLLVGNLMTVGGGITGVFFLVTGPVARGQLGAQLTAVAALLMVVTLINVLLLSYVAYVNTGLLQRRPKLAVQIRNPQADGAPLVYARRENTLEILVHNRGAATAKFIHAAFRWIGGDDNSLRGPKGAYLDRRFWSEGDGRVRVFVGGLEKVVLAGRNIPMAELHISRPESSVKLAYRIYCEDMDEIQGEVEVALREIT